MKPSFFIPLLLAVASISATAMLFLDKPHKSTLRRVAPPSPIEIKWGEGTEAGTPEAATQGQ